MQLGSALCPAFLVISVLSSGLCKENIEPGTRNELHQQMAAIPETKSQKTAVGLLIESDEKGNSTIDDSIKSITHTDGGNATISTSRNTTVIGQGNDDILGGSGPRLEAISVKVLLGESDAIALNDMSSTKRQPVLLNVTALNAYSVDFHITKSLIFYAAQDKIFSGPLMGMLPLPQVSPVINNTGGGLVRIAVDWVHDSIYWMSDTYQTVQMADLDGGNRKLLVDNVKRFSYPNNIVVDPYEKALFFVSDHTVFTADLEGGNLKQVNIDQNIRGDIGRGVRCLALDRQHRKLYFSGKTLEEDETTHSPSVYIAKSNYDGSDLEDLKNVTGWNDIYSIDVFRNTLYFAHYQNSHSNTDILWVANLSETVLIPQNLYVPKYIKHKIWSIKVYHPEVQTTK